MLEEGRAEGISSADLSFRVRCQYFLWHCRCSSAPPKTAGSQLSIYRPLTKESFALGITISYPHEFAVLDPDGYFF